MKHRRVRTLLSTVVAVLVGAAVVPGAGLAVTPPDQVSVRTTNALSPAKYCTAAQAARKAAGKRVNCRVRPRYCSVVQATRKAAGKRVNCVVRPKVCTRRVDGKRVRVRCPKRAVAPRVAPAATTVSSAQLNVLLSYIDENGANDVPGQKDLTSTSVNTTATDLIVTVNWDDTSVSGNNSADACFLFDAGTDGFVDTAICVAWKTNAVLDSVTKYTCNNTKVDRCAGPSAAVALDNSLCTVVANATDPFGASGGTPNVDARASCTFPLTLVASGGVVSSLINTCSYPSGQPNSDPSDCVRIPRDGSLKLVKVLVGGPAGYTGPFNLAYSCKRTFGSGANATVVTLSGTESVAGNTSVTIGMSSGFTCTVTETPPTPPQGYVWSSTSPTVSVPVTIAEGQTSTVTVTNTLVALPGTLTIKKVVVNDDGGTKTAANFTFAVNGGASTPFESDAQNDVTVPAGTYSVVETADSGYATTYDNCSQVVIPPGGSATCTITNDDKPGTLIVKKVVVNDNGGTKTAADFSFAVNGGGATSFEADGQNNVSVSAGTYTVVESADSGYATTYDNCSQVVVPNGGSATCTITNDDKPGTLIVKKVVVNDNGGSKTAADFSFAVDGGSPVTFDETGENAVTVDAGTHSVVETADSGYATTYDNCSDVAIANGATATCTITNDDKPGTLIVKKVVVNDDGGLKKPTDFSFAVDGGSPVTFDETGENAVTVDAGTHSVVETADSGYATTYDNCSRVVVVNGGSATCTITNDDRPGTLIVKKVVVNDNGGSKGAEDFTFSVNGAAAVAFNANAQNEVSVPAGTYSVVETSDSGYATTYDNCSELTIANGETATCTITNDDKPGTLIVTKVVVNDDGGTRAATSFAYRLDGAPAVDFLAGNAAAQGTSGPLSVDAGTHTVTEPATPGYAATNGCIDVVVTNGETAQCTITNDDIAPKLALVKVVRNGTNGSAVPADFQLSATATGEAPSDRDISRPGNVGTAVDVYAGVLYTLDETELAGYAASDWSCANTDSEDQSANWSQDGAAIVLQPGANVTCTIINRIRDLGITKTTQDGPFAPGDTIEYTVMVTNTGAVTIPADEITVTDPMLGDGLVLQGEPGPLAPGESRVYTGTRAVTSRDCGSIVNTATVSIPNDAIADNNSASVEASVICTADLALAKSADKQNYDAGETITYTVTVTNVGTTIVPLAAVGVADPMLSDLTLQGDQTEIAPQESATFVGTKVATTEMCGTVTNTATVSYEGDTNSENDTASATVNVVCVLGPTPTRLRITKVGPRLAKQGKYVAYRLRVKNVGPVASINTTITDRLPKGLSLRSLPAGATIRSGVITWRIGTLQPGSSRTVSVIVRANSRTTGRRCNVGFARATNAPRVSDPACTRFVAVAGVRTPGVTG